MPTPEGMTPEEANNPICLDIMGRGIMLDTLFKDMPSPLKEHSLDLVALADIIASQRGEKDYEKWAELHGRKMTLMYKLGKVADFMGMPRDVIMKSAETLSSYDEKIYPRKTGHD